MEKPRAYTADEARKMFLNCIRNACRFWLKVEGHNEKEKLEGLAFSILNLFDGTSMGICSLDIVLRPHEDDKEFHIEEGSNYFEDGMVINDAMLHEEWHQL